MAGRGPNTPRKTAIAVNRKGRRSRTYRPRGSARRVNDWPKGNPANGLQPYRLCLACWQERLTALEVSNFLAHFASPPPRLDPQCERNQDGWTIRQDGMDGVAMHNRMLR